MKSVTLTGPNHIGSHLTLFNNLINTESPCYQKKISAFQINIADWLNEQRFPLPNQICKALLKGKSTTTLPNQKKIAHIHQYETDYLYQEIFLDQVYAKHGINLPDYACVIDIGANIGLFSLFVNTKCYSPLVFSIEPIKQTYEILKTNSQLHNLGLAFQIGIGAQDGRQRFTHYKNSTVFSGQHTDFNRDTAKVRQIIENKIKQSMPDDDELDPNLEIERFSSLFMENRLAYETEQVTVCTLSTFIKQQYLASIDLLKIDAEGSELEILDSISNIDWQKIERVIIEVHMNHPTDLEHITRVLERQHFNVIVDKELLLKGTEFYNVYGIKKGMADSETAGCDSKLNKQLIQISAALRYYLSQTSNQIKLDMMLDQSHRALESHIKHFIETFDDQDQIQILLTDI